FSISNPKTDCTKPFELSPSTAEILRYSKFNFPTGYSLVILQRLFTCIILTNRIYSSSVRLLFVSLIRLSYVHSGENKVVSYTPTFVCHTSIESILVVSFQTNQSLLLKFRLPASPVIRFPFVLAQPPI